jgi:hypothetical protein
MQKHGAGCVRLDQLVMLLLMVVQLHPKCVQQVCTLLPAVQRARCAQLVRNVTRKEWQNQHRVHAALTLHLARACAEPALPATRANFQRWSRLFATLARTRTAGKKHALDARQDLRALGMWQPMT